MTLRRNRRCALPDGRLYAVILYIPFCRHAVAFPTSASAGRRLFSVAVHFLLPQDAGCGSGGCTYRHLCRTLNVRTGSATTLLVAPLFCGCLRLAVPHSLPRCLRGATRHACNTPCRAGRWVEPPHLRCCAWDVLRAYGTTCWLVCFRSSGPCCGRTGGGVSVGTLQTLAPRHLPAFEHTCLCLYILHLVYSSFCVSFT